MSKILLFTRFERFWHWTQAFLVIVMLITGGEIRALYSLFGFDQAVALHEMAAWALITLWIFGAFWHITTGEWRQYIPTTENLMGMMRYYAYGIFRDEDKPWKKTRRAKHNPLQRLAYMAIQVFITPLIWVTGLLYLFYASWSQTELSELLSLDRLADLHVIAAYAMAAFLIVHLYMVLTTGHPWYASIKSMLTGRDEETGRDEGEEA